MINNRMTQKRILCVGTLICLLAVFLSLSLGTVSFSPKQLFDILMRRHTEEMYLHIFWYARLPRTLACLAAGGALAVSGAILQNVLSNKLASPSIIGVNAGAGLGVTLCCSVGFLSGWAVSGAAFIGSLFSVLMISLFSGKTGASKTTVILGGVALNSILNALRESINVLIPDTASLSADFRVGGFSSVSYIRLFPALTLILLSLALVFTFCNELDVLTLGDDTAHGVGLPVKKYRIFFLLLAALLAGSAVSLSGLLGFVGLIIPHLVRWLTGNESRRLLPLCALFGAGFVTLCDLMARLLFSPYELPVGILMSILGGPVFVLILIRQKGGRTHA